VAGRFGAEALEKLGEAGIEPLTAVGTKVSQAIELFRRENT
jgi:predicted Fe-Mo cluster-binding NifX family protein